MHRLIFFAFSALLAIFPFSKGAFAAESLPALTSSQSGVTVKVTPQNLKGNLWEFGITFETHTQQLNDDLLKTAVLVTSDGKRLSPAGWQGDRPGGHHRKGVLRFSAVTPAPTSLELRITRAGEPNARSFRWTLK